MVIDGSDVPENDSSCNVDETSGDDVSIPTDNDGELLDRWAASEIQSQWRRFKSRMKHSRHSSNVRSGLSGEMCCACLAPIVLSKEDIETTPTQLFCAPCKSKLQRGHDVNLTSGINSSISHSIGSPLPKLSLLVQTEAKYQDQLRLLRQQQELLRQQQHEMEMRKKSQAETLVIEKQLARQRRKEFKQIMARRQAEESARLQELAAAKDQLANELTKPRIKPSAPARSRSVTPTESSSMIEPTQLRRHQIAATPQRSGVRETDNKQLKAAELAERAAHEHRRKQKLETLKCYAQDLTPLVHGHKPTKLPLPMALTIAPQHGVSFAMKRLKKPPQSASKKPGKVSQLAPLGQPRNLNQYEPEASPALRVAIPRQSYETYALDSSVSTKAAPTPLTAEIRPVSWMHELMSTDPVLATAHAKMQLTTLYEVDDRDDTIGFASPTVQNAVGGQRLTLAPLGTPTPTPTPAPPPVAPVSYSSERLASLLQKYNVSVSQTTVP